MGMFDRFLREATPSDPEVPRLKAQLETAQFKLEEAAHSMERFYQEDIGWEALFQDTEKDMSPEGRRRATELCRIMHIANPVIKRGLAVRAGYVHGQGVGVQAPDGTEDDQTQDVNAVVQAFLDDPGNRKAFFGAQSKMELENRLGTDGNVYAVVFTNPTTGFVKVRVLDSLEITDQITNPEDKSETWFYRRDFVEQYVGERTTKVQSRQRTVWYPALSHTPTRRQSVIDGDPVEWNAKVYHIRVNTVGKWGVGDAYAAIPWARAHKEFLEDWAKYMAAISRIAYRMSGKKSTSQQARHALQGLKEAGGVAMMDEGTQLEAMPKSGAAIDSESSRPLAAMAAAALGIPVTMLLSDPGQTGARAVAETLDKPTVLEMKGRQEIWTEAFRALCGYAVDQAVLAPAGPLQGGILKDPYSQEEEVVLTGNGDRTLTITWPDLEDASMADAVKAIAEADGTGKLPPLETMRLLLRALGVRDVDEILEDWTDEEGNFIDPNVNAGSVAIDAFNAGLNPADALRGGEEDGDQ
ncbi:portal protein [Brevibacterium phage LuckyBarnes]|uniref:Portal protein n=1 Tax=Brevibacterium phage LuckyBarnes TaxID=2027888 RepID=A0A249XNL8_9CAUD|nr:portal protein [Brevibacterium phage LuckyBarnes]ASZ73329.1 portal protein [Brevibacterium phage LuckyBarnes]